MNQQEDFSLKDEVNRSWTVSRIRMMRFMLVEARPTTIQMYMKRWMALPM